MINGPEEETGLDGKVAVGVLRAVLRRAVIAPGGDGVLGEPDGEVAALNEGSLQSAQLRRR